MASTWQLRVKGKQPSSIAIEVRYQLFIAESINSGTIIDSGWIPWSADGYVFETLNPVLCYVVRYGLRDDCPSQSWTHNVVRIASDDLIISMLQLHTQTRSERIGREQNVSETYLNTEFDRGGAGGN